MDKNALRTSSDHQVMQAPAKVFLHSYGCQMNRYDGELVSRLLAQEGFALTSSIEDAQVILFNTCSVRDHAEKRVLGRIQTLSGLKRKRPGLILGVLGCMGQRLGEELRGIAPEVDLVLGPDAYRVLPQLLKEKLDGSNGHHYFCAGDADETYGDIVPQRREGVNAFVAIMRGCNNFCSYCIVPYARGRERSRPVEEILNEIHLAVADGFPEVTLLGQNVNSYRWGQADFPDLLEKVSLIDGLKRIRFLTSHPRDLSDRLISIMARGGKICPSLHLPVQSGSDRILELMGRGYTRAEYLKKVARLRCEMADLALSTDLLCGFPSETEDDFGRTLELMEEAAFDSAFTFKYSPRPGTNAAKMMDDVPEAVKIERLERMIERVRALADRSNHRMIGKTVQVLLENPSPQDAAEWTGRTTCGRVALTPGPYQRGEFAAILVEEVRGFSLWGRGQPETN